MVYENFKKIESLEEQLPQRFSDQNHKLNLSNL